MFVAAVSSSENLIHQESSLLRTEGGVGMGSVAARGQRTGGPPPYQLIEQLAPTAQLHYLKYKQKQ